MKFTLTLLLILVLGSCGCSKKMIPETKTVEKTVTVREVIRDTVFVTEADSSSARFELITDTNNGTIKPVLIGQTPGRKMLVPKVQIRNNVLTVDCKSEAEKLFAQWKDTYTDSVSKTVIQRNHTVEVEKDLSTWQHIQIWLGRAFIVVFIGLLYLMYKRYWPKSKV